MIMLIVITGLYSEGLPRHLINFNYYFFIIIYLLLFKIIITDYL